MTGFFKSQYTTATYSFKMADWLDGRQLYCVITDKKGEKVQTRTATVSLKGPEITQQPQSVKTQIGEQVSVAVTATGEDLQYQWYVKNPNMTGFFKSQYTTATYSFEMADWLDGRQLYCVVTDKNGKSVKTQTATVTLKKPEITRQPQSVKVQKGGAVSIPVTATGEELQYQWYVKNPGMTGFFKSQYTSSTYSFTMDDWLNGRQLYCVITDKYGNAVRTNTVTVNLPNPVVKITKQPVATSAKKNQKVSVSIAASGDGLSYQWYYKDTDDAKFDTSTNKTSTYTTTMISSRNGRKIYCVVKDKYGNKVQTNTVTLTMK